MNNAIFRSVRKRYKARYRADLFEQFLMETERKPVQLMFPLRRREPLTFLGIKAGHLRVFTSAAFSSIRNDGT